MELFPIKLDKQEILGIVDRLASSDVQDKISRLWVDYGKNWKDKEEEPSVTELFLAVLK